MEKVFTMSPNMCLGCLRSIQRFALAPGYHISRRWRSDSGICTFVQSRFNSMMFEFDGVDEDIPGGFYSGERGAAFINIWFFE